MEAEGQSGGRGTEWRQRDRVEAEGQSGGRGTERHRVVPPTCYESHCTGHTAARFNTVPMYTAAPPTPPKYVGS